MCVTATPVRTAQRGTRLHLDWAGNCTDLEMRWRINVPSAAQDDTASSTASAQTGTWTTAHAFLMGEDVFGIDMYKNRSEVSWNHTSDKILSYNDRLTSWGTVHAIRICLGPPPHCIVIYLGDGWTIEEKTSGVTPATSGAWRAWNHTAFHAHLPFLPDPRARTKTALWFEPGGGFACDFYNKVNNNYAFGLVSSCEEGRSPS